MELIKVLLGIIGFFVLIVGAYFFANLDTFMPEEMEEIRNHPHSEQAKIDKKAIFCTGIVIFTFCVILII